MKAKPTKAQVEARVSEILRIRLDGAEIWDVREYVREKEQEDGSPWKLPEGAKPLSDSQLWRYIARADKLIAESCRASRKKLLRRHLAQRRNLYARAVNAGDYRAALAAARDEAELLGLYPARRAEHGEGKPSNGHPTVINIFERVAVLAEQLRAGQPVAVDARVQAGALPGDGRREQVHSPDAHPEADGVPVAR
jgi:hypothetical protein